MVNSRCCYPVLVLLFVLFVRGQNTDGAGRDLLASSSSSGKYSQFGMQIPHICQRSPLSSPYRLYFLRSSTEDNSLTLVYQLEQHTCEVKADKCCEADLDHLVLRTVPNLKVTAVKIGDEDVSLEKVVTTRYLNITNVGALTAKVSAGNPLQIRITIDSTGYKSLREVCPQGRYPGACDFIGMNLDGSCCPESAAVPFPSGTGSGTTQPGGEEPGEVKVYNHEQSPWRLFLAESATTPAGVFHFFLHYSPESYSSSQVELTSPQKLSITLPGERKITSVDINGALVENQEVTIKDNSTTLTVSSFLEWHQYAASEAEYVRVIIFTEPIVVTLDNQSPPDNHYRRRSLLESFPVPLSACGESGCPVILSGDQWTVRTKTFPLPPDVHPTCATAPEEDTPWYLEEGGETSSGAFTNIRFYLVYHASHVKPFQDRCSIGSVEKLTLNLQKRVIPESATFGGVPVKISHEESGNGTRVELDLRNTQLLAPLVDPTAFTLVIRARGKVSAVCPLKGCGFKFTGYSHDYCCISGITQDTTPVVSDPACCLNKPGVQPYQVRYLNRTTQFLKTSFRFLLSLKDGYQHVAGTNCSSFRIDKLSVDIDPGLTVTGVDVINTPSSPVVAYVDKTFTVKEEGSSLQWVVVNFAGGLEVGEFLSGGLYEGGLIVSITVGGSVLRLCDSLPDSHLHYSLCQWQLEGFGAQSSCCPSFVTQITGEPVVPDLPCPGDCKDDLSGQPFQLDYYSTTIGTGLNGSEVKNTTYTFKLSVVDPLKNSHPWDGEEKLYQDCTQMVLNSITFKTYSYINIKQVLVDGIEYLPIVEVDRVLPLANVVSLVNLDYKSDTEGHVLIDIKTEQDVVGPLCPTFAYTGTSASCAVTLGGTRGCCPNFVTAEYTPGKSTRL